MADYNNDDFVYVNPADKSVIGKVEWISEGLVKQKEIETDDELAEVSKEKKGKKRKKKRCFCPWGTYRSMKNYYRLEGKVQETDGTNSLDEAIKKLEKDPFFD